MSGFMFLLRDCILDINPHPNKLCIIFIYKYKCNSELLFMILTISTAVICYVYSCSMDAPHNRTVLIM